MRSNRYLNVVLTVIAIELGWLAVSQMGVPISAQQAATRVVITGVDLDRNAIPVVLRGAEIPIKIDSDRPIRIQEPVTVRIPVTTSPVPGL